MCLILLLIPIALVCLDLLLAPLFMGAGFVILLAIVALIAVFCLLAGLDRSLPPPWGHNHGSERRRIPKATAPIPDLWDGINPAGDFYRANHPRPDAPQSGKNGGKRLD